jgi:hypothetical protein
MRVISICHGPHPFFQRRDKAGIADYMQEEAVSGVCAFFSNRMAAWDVRCRVDHAGISSYFV